MSNNFQTRNNHKTEFIDFGTKAPFPVTAGNTIVNVSDTVRNFGIMFDTNLSMVPQVNANRQSCFFQIQNIGRIKRFITPEATKILVQTMVLSRLDCGNAVLCGIPDYLLTRVQHIQNATTYIFQSTLEQDIL